MDGWMVEGGWVKGRGYQQAQHLVQPGCSLVVARVSRASTNSSVVNNEVVPD
jgi:hypothetical protein